MIEALCISLSFLLAAHFLIGAWRYSQAPKALELYLKRFSELAENEKVPLPVLEKLHVMFKQSCHPCAALLLTIHIFRYILDQKYRYSLSEHRSADLEGIEPDVALQISETAIALFIYASYSLPGGIITRILLRRMENKQDKRKTKFLISNAEDAPARHSFRGFFAHGVATGAH